MVIDLLAFDRIALPRLIFPDELDLHIREAIFVLVVGGVCVGECLVEAGGYVIRRVLAECFHEAGEEWCLDIHPKPSERGTASGFLSEHTVHYRLFFEVRNEQVEPRHRHPEVEDYLGGP